MKFWVPVLLLCMTACSKTTTTAPPKEVVVQKPTQALCDKVYDTLLTNALASSLEEGESYTAQQVTAGKIILDLQYRADGRADKLFDVCLNKASVEMAECWSKTTSLEGMDICTLMWKDTIQTKKNP